MSMLSFDYYNMTVLYTFFYELKIRIAIIKNLSEYWGYKQDWNNNSNYLVFGSLTYPTSRFYHVGWNLGMVCAITKSIKFRKRRKKSC